QMSCPSYKIDSNDAGLRVARELCIKELPIAAVAASGLVTVVTLPEIGDVVVIGSVTYEFTDTLADPNDVLIGLDDEATASNLNAAINAGAGEGTLYGTGTTANPTVSSTVLSNEVSLTADVAGTG